MRIRLTCFLALVFTLATTTLQGQERQVRFSCIGFGTVPQDIYFQSSTGQQEVLVGGGVRGAQLSYTGLMPLQFFTLVPDGKGGQRRVVQAEANIPVDISDALLVFMPGSNEPGELPWRVYVMNDARNAFKAGEIRFVNLAEKPIAGVLGEDVVRLLPDQQETITPKTNKEGFGIKLAAYLDEQWEPFFSSRWRYRSNIRMMILFLPDSETGKVLMRAVPENVGTNG